jgi:2-hydroxychromene-2-carboxylate isomerase
MKLVDFIFDFASPNTYLVHKVFPEIEMRTDSKLNYIPCLLGGIFKQTNNQAPMNAFADVLGKNAYENLELVRFIEEHKITTFKTNPYFPVNTLILMRGAIVAQNEGNLQKYVEAGFHHMWESPKNMGDPDVYLQAMSNSGFDGLDLLEKMQSKEVKEKLILNTSEAVKKGTFGMPTFFVGDQMFYGKERLMQIEKIVSD